MNRPVFFDPSGRRGRWTARAMLLLLVAVVLAAAAFAATLIDVPIPPPLAVAMERPHARPLQQQVDRIGHRIAHATRLGAWLPASRARGGPPSAAAPTTVGFYVPWDDASRASLAAHARQLDWLVPGLMSVTGPDHRLTSFADPQLDALLAGLPRRPKILPMVQNALNGSWDGAGTAALLHDPRARKALLDRLEPALAARNAAGVVFDLESLPAAAQPDYKRFLAEAHARFAPRGWLVTLAVPVDNPDWKLADYARIADRLFLMNYDEHWSDGPAGPIASQGWFVQKLRAAVAATGRDKAIVAIGSYAYDWSDAGTSDTLSIEEAWLVAHDSGATIRFDPASGNATFDYSQDGHAHHVWMLDAASVWNQLRATAAAGVPGVALWRLGTEDPGVWTALRHARSGAAGLPDLTVLRSLGNVDVEGEGEILRIDGVPTQGQRLIAGDAAGLIRAETYQSVPTPFVVRRTGARPGLVALTFDDGPDPDWTPRILDILKARQAPGTFFVIGENALAHPALLNRIVAEGNEIGNHSYTHPNLAQVSPRGTRLELNLTQRLVEAYTGHGLRLFRAPYFGDAEPTTGDELGPALIAQQDGYLNVGLHVDPGDWTRPGVDAIVERTIAQVTGTDPGGRQGQIVLLHDSGGDRAQTVAALPRIIDGLRARGYRFVPVSTLAGLSSAQVMPAVTGTDLLSVRTDVAIFLLLAGLAWILKFLFFSAIGLGMARAVILAALAVAGARRHVVPPPADPARLVSVIIPAFNEARVIAASVRRVLASTDARIEVIVVDDGSTDATSAIVAAEFAHDPRVRLLTLANGGKARALNRALQDASGEVVVALDADTQFEPETIRRLTRWFADPAIGAVAGNAKVGNRVNLVTRWQAVEYVTAQNLERRALARFDAITVVPGAVGAWRRAALDDVGGYPHDTLAEDQDLTIAIQRRGWRVAHDPDAVAWTEAPETLSALAKQRFRWAFGTLQCLWKHRSILRRRQPAGLALVGVPQAWLFQIGFAMVSPVIDLALLLSIAGTALRVQQHGWAQTQSDVLRMAVYWLLFTAVDVGCGWIAYRLERREPRFPMGLLVAQRIVYRQLMYSVVIRAVSAALKGPWVGWGSLERSGRVDAI